MILNLLVIAMIGLIAYLWSSQGMFSAMMHFVCVIVAGAIAFAFWEPVAGMLIGMGGVVQELAFGLGLMLPFLVALFVLRVACDKLVPKGMDFDDASNFVGGLVFGAASGFLTAGVLVTSISYFRLPPNFLGYTPVQADPSGTIVKGSNLWVPVDSMTVGLYEFVSRGSLATSAPLAVRAPDAHLRGALVRHTFDGKGRTSIAPADVDIVGRYTIPGVSAADVAVDSFNVTSTGEPVRQDVKRFDGEAIGANARLEGFVFRFKAGAKETKGAKFSFARGQIQLIATDPSGEGRILEPIAIVSQGDPTRLDLGRWRFDSASNIVYSSVGGASEAPVAFEFVIPQNWTPTDLLIRNVRFPISADGGGREFASVADRDEAIRSRSLFTELAIADPVLEEARAQTQSSQRPPITNPVRVEDRIGPAWSINTTNRGGLRVENFERTNYIVDGQHTLPRNQVQERGLDQNLRLERFGETLDTKIVQVDVSVRSPLSLLGKAADTAKQVLPPQLVDNLGQVYDAIGYVYDDGRNVTIRFTPGDPIRALTQLPTLSPSRDNERLTLIFRPSAGVQIVSFNIGPEVIEELNPPIQLPRPRQAR